MRRPLGLISLLLALVALPGPVPKAMAATRDTLTFSGRLLTKDRLRAPQGKYPFRFSLYAAAEGGSPLWAESWVGANSLTVRHGLFTVSLGNLAPLPSTVLAADSLYLTVEFDGNQDGSFEQLFQNRIAVTAAPFAVSAQRATTAANAEKLGGSSVDDILAASNSRLLGASSLLFQGNLTVAGSLKLSSLTSGVIKSVNGTLTSGATTSDLPEGSNLYYTVDRARQALSAAAPLVYGAGQISLGYDGLNLTVAGSQLTTIQAINQDASPRFGGLGLGTTAGSSLLTLASGTGTTYGLAIGSDVQLYRSAAATLRTDASFKVGENALSVDPAGQVAINGPQTSGYVLSVYGGDANVKLQDIGATWGTPTNGSGSFIGFFDSAGVRGGWLGYGWGYTDNLAVANELPGKSIYFSTVETGGTTGADTVRLSLSPEGKLALGLGTTPPAAELHLASSYVIGWDNGAGGVDANLYRTGPASLKTDARLTVAGASLAVGSDTDNVTYSLGSAAGFTGAVRWQSGGLDRWLIAKNATAESGSNAGSDFVLQRFNDAGSLIGTPLSIARSTGQVTIPSLYAQGFELNSGVLDTAGLRFTQLTAASAASGGSGKVLSVNAQGDLILVNDQVGDSTALPSGSEGQTLRHNGSNWIATDFLANTGSGIGIGVTTPGEELTLANSYRLGWDNGSGAVDVNLYRGAADELKTDDAFEARKLSLSGALSGDGSESDIYSQKTIPLLTDDTYGSFLSYTPTSGDTSSNIVGSEVQLLAGYTGSATTAALGYRNASASTANTIFKTFQGNYGVYGITEGVTVGDNAGVVGFAKHGDRNAGVIGNAYVSKASAINIGVFGIGLNGGLGGTQIGGYFGLRNDAPASFVSGALIADNGTTSSDIFRAFDDDQEVFTIADGGNVTSAGQLTTSSGFLAVGAIANLQSESTVVDLQPTGAAGGQRSRLLAVGKDALTNGHLALATTRSDGTSYYEPLKINGETRAVSLTEATSATSALVLGASANLYSPSANYLKTDSFMEIAGGLKNSGDFLSRDQIWTGSYHLSNADVAAGKSWKITFPRYFSGNIQVSSIRSVSDSSTLNYLLDASYNVHFQAYPDGTNSYFRARKIEKLNTNLNSRLYYDHTGLTLYLTSTGNSHTFSVVATGQGNFSSVATTLDTGSPVGNEVTAPQLALDGSGQLALSAAGVSGGILLGGDANLYRSAADMLKTDDAFVGGVSVAAPSLIADNYSMVSSGVGGAFILRNSADSTNRWAIYRADSETGSNAGSNLNFYRYSDAGASLGVPLSIARSTGAVNLAQATSAASSLILGGDANLYRSSAGILQTDSTLSVKSGSAVVEGDVRGVLSLKGLYNGATNIGAVQFINAAGVGTAQIDGYNTTNNASSQGALLFRTRDGSALVNALFLDSAQKLWIGANNDTNLYRSAADTLKTDDSFVALALQAGGSGGLALTVGNDAAVYDVNLANTLNIRGAQDATAGAITFGSSADTNLYRGGANQLKTDDSLAITGNISVGTSSISPQVGVGINLISSASGTASYAALLYNTQWGNADLYGVYARTEVPTLGNGTTLTMTNAASVVGHLNIVPETAGGLPETANITNAYNFWARNGYTAGVNATNHYGLYVDTLGFGTNRWGVYVQTDPSYFGGHVTFANGTTGASSLRYKNNVQTLSDNFAAILDLEPKSFTYKDSGYQDIGVIAEEVDALGLRQLVSYDSLGRPDGVKYDRLPLYMLEVLKADHATLTAQGIRVDNLEGAVNGLAARVSALEMQLQLPAGSDLVVERDLRVLGRSSLAETEIAGALTVRDEVADDTEFDGTENDSEVGTITDLAGVGAATQEVEVTIPDQGSTNYTVSVTWLDDPGQPYWVALESPNRFKLRLGAPVVQDRTFRYVLIKH